MERYNLLTEENILKAKTHWGKGNQYNAIRMILDKYPSPKDFKNAVLQTGDKKSLQLIQSLDDNASRSDYVDFLQNVFTKYSSTGKHLLSGLAGVGIGAAVGYLAGNAVKPRNQQDIYQDFNNRDNIVNSVGHITNKGLVAAGDSLAYLSNGKLGTGIFNAGAPGWYNDLGGASFNNIRGAQVLGGAAGAGVGALGAHGIQSWRQKKIQDQIEALKNK